jgi:hypothetical protein
MPDRSASGAKICVVCRKDCSTRPRTKDPQGRYTCRACFDAIQEQQRAAAIAPEGELHLNDLASLAQAEAAATAAIPSARSACGGCGRPLLPDAAICTACGYNLHSGQTVGTRVKEVSAAAERVAEIGGRFAEAMFVSNPIAWVVAAIVGGGVGMSLYIGLGVQTGREYIILVPLTGLGAGAAVAMLTRDRASNYSGIVAGIVAVMLILSGRYLLMDQIIRKVIREAAANIVIDDAAATSLLADQLAAQWQSQGRELKWPEGQSVETAFYEEDYPADLWKAAAKELAAMTPEARQTFEQQARDDFANSAGEFAAEYSDEFFRKSFTEANTDEPQRMTKGAVLNTFLRTAAGQTILIGLSAFIAFSLGSGRGWPF